MDRTYTQRELDLARLAAYIDGEGTIHLDGCSQGKRRAYGYRLRISVVNTDLRLLMWCKEVFGGAVRRNRAETENWMNVWVWNISHQTAMDILMGCLPFFVIKRDQAELGIAFGKTFSRQNRSCKGLPQAVKHERDALRGQLFEIRRSRTRTSPEAA